MECSNCSDINRALLEKYRFFVATEWRHGRKIRLTADNKCLIRAARYESPDHVDREVVSMNAISPSWLNYLIFFVRAVFFRDKVFFSDRCFLVPQGMEVCSKDLKNKTVDIFFGSIHWSKIFISWDKINIF